ncbi:MAG: response regulator [Spirochaetes bacterium]|nr:response regulator [Spirochaetota bacterium]
MSKVIVHVDDDFEIRESVKLILERENFTCLSFETVEEAEETISKNKPDLVILDIMVEEINSGLTSYQKLKKLYPDLPVIFLTSLGDEIQPYFDMRGEWAYIIEKPVDPAKILSAVNSKINE